jgi:hypothetical protein
MEVNGFSIRVCNDLAIRKGDLQGLQGLGLVDALCIRDKKVTCATRVQDCCPEKVGWGTVKIIENMIYTSVLIFVTCRTPSEKLHTKGATTHNVVLRGSFLVATSSSVTGATDVGLSHLLSMGPAVVVILGLVRIFYFVVSARVIGRPRLVANEVLDFLVASLVPGIMSSKLDHKRLHSLGKASHCMAVSCCGCGKVFQCSHISFNEIYHNLVSSSHVGLVKSHMGGCWCDQPVPDVRIGK